MVMMTPPAPAHEAGAPPGGISNAVKLAMVFFLKDDHYRQLLRILSKEWDSCHSLTAAVQLMKAHGVHIDREEEDLLRKLPEDKMIEALVQRMPAHSREQFEHFFLQLSFVASTTTRLRNALEAGQPEVIEEALESAENVGVLSYLMQMTIYQAGNEVRSREEMHESWLGESNQKMAPLLSTSVAAMAVQKDLAQARSTIANYHGDAKNKSRGVLQNMGGANLEALRQNVFISWNAHVRKVKVEAEVKAEYQDQIDAVNKKLFTMREEQLKNVKKVLAKQSGAAMDAIMIRCIEALKAEEQEQIKRAENAKQGEELMAKIQSFSASAAENAKAVMSRMSAGNDSGLKTMAWQGWRQYMDEFKNDSELSKSLREKERQVEAFKLKQKNGASTVVNSMAHANNATLLEATQRAWIDLIKERKESERVSVALNAKSAQMGSFQSRNKAAGLTASEKTAVLQDQQLEIFTMCTWKKYARVEALRRKGKAKDSGSKKELVAVKSSFKDFAAELEASLKEGTPRVDVKPKRQAPTTAPPAIEAGSPEQQAPEQQAQEQEAPAPDGEMA